ncbi:MAG: hypothetical protein Q9212_003106 [Teloschistes hypoglaucus]
MAGLVVLDVIQGLVGLSTTIAGVIPPKDEHQPVVRIAAGLSSQESDTTSGSQPGVSNGGDDALCIAYITLTQPDGTSKAWYGDTAKECGADWYHPLLKTGKDDYQPSCFWIDRDSSNGLRFQGLGLHLNDFAATHERAAQFNDNKDLMCNAAPRFRMYEKMEDKDYIPFFNPPLDLEPGNLTDADPGAVSDQSRWTMPQEGPHITKALINQGPSGRMRRRQSTDPVVFGPADASVVIVSTSPNHSAKELCESETSRGFDFVSSTEHLFCDMTAKKIWPVCSATNSSACFDLKSSTMTPGKGLRGRDSGSGIVPPAKHYSKTVRWGQ